MRYALYSDCGGREENEDAVRVFANDAYICAILADGLGGHGGGALASQTVIDTIADLLQSTDANAITGETLKEWCSLANSRVLEKQTSVCHMKTTMVLLFYIRNSGKVILAHVGDSRGYYFKDAENCFCTFDHSVSRMAVLSGEISMDAIRNHVDRNKLLRCIGGSDSVKTEIDEILIEPQADNAFLLCSDGFWEYVTEDIMENILQKTEDPSVWLDTMKMYLDKVAPAENDNNSAVAIMIREE